MKKLLIPMMSLFIAPTIDNLWSGYCMAENTNPTNPHLPAIEPVKSSYYDYEDGVLYVYGSDVAKVMKIEVKFRGNVVLVDYIEPRTASTIYDFSNNDSGTYSVVISTDSAVLTTFSFVIF